MGSFITIAFQLLFVIYYGAYSLGASVSIDDLDPAFSYVPSTSWRDIEGMEAFDYGGSHKLTEDPSAFAEITYSFTSFSFVSALYPYQVAVNIFVDDAIDPIYIDLQDYNTPDVGSGPGTVPHQVVYSSPEGEYAQHTLRIAIPEGDPYAVIDQILFDVPDGLVSTVSPSPSPTQSTTIISSDTLSGFTSPSTSTPGNPTGSSASTSARDTDIQAERKAHRLAVALGIVGTFFGLLVFALLWWWCRRRASRLDYEERAALVSAGQRRLKSPSAPIHKESILDGRATTTLTNQDGRATNTSSGLDGLSIPPVQPILSSPILPTDNRPTAGLYHSSNLSDGASTPRAMSILPTAPTPIIPLPAKLESAYPVNRADSSSYYDTATSVVGAVPQYASIAGFTPYGEGDGLAEHVDDYSGSTEKLGF